MTEWELQERLTHQWLATGQVTLDGEAFLLVAWEVMSDYRINDHRRHWNLPSVDFLLLDRSGHLVVLELKRAVISPRQTWLALCQVSHRAAVLGAAYRPELLVAAYLDCYLRDDGRRLPGGHAPDLAVAHAELFDKTPLAAFPAVPIRRYLMAESFGPSARRVYATFSSTPQSEIKAELSRYQAPAKEFTRYLGCDLNPARVSPDAVVIVDTAGNRVTRL